MPVDCAVGVHPTRNEGLKQLANVGRTGRLQWNQACKSELNRRWTQMDADEGGEETGCFTHALQVQHEKAITLTEFTE